MLMRFQHYYEFFKGSYSLFCNLEDFFLLFRELTCCYYVNSGSKVSERSKSISSGNEGVRLC